MKHMAIITGTAAITVILLAAACGGDKTPKTSEAEKDAVVEHAPLTPGSQFNPDIAYSSFTDPRDGHNYHTVKIGDRTWMAQNLNINTADSWCYEDEEANCLKYGRLYTWDAAMKDCPAGWRLPGRADWSDLVLAVGGEDAAGEKLKSKNGWDNAGGGTDDYGFSALPGGLRLIDGKFLSGGAYGNWWSATAHESDSAYIRDMGFGLDRSLEVWNHKSGGLSVRCLRE